MLFISVRAKYGHLSLPSALKRFFVLFAKPVSAGCHPGFHFNDLVTTATFVHILFLIHDSNLLRCLFRTRVLWKRSPQEFQIHPICSLALACRYSFFNLHLRRSSIPL